MKILVATTNPGKLEELSMLLGDIAGRIEWVSLRDFPGLPEIVEDGATFADNARKKALGYAQATGLWTLADDSGLCIDALHGQPGVLSARFAADECPAADRKTLDKANYQKVLRLLKDIPDSQRTARFFCHLALVDDKQILLEATGAVEGVIINQPRGQNGFGYDPIFYIPSLGKTAAQLDNSSKNQVSHRGHAIRQMKPLLEQLLAQRQAGR
ncbi:MAG TPA: RdgB/HAM1 family non-canonical purine NTP pyrophosphatase [Anaerohalosphaeraceae bacterium]|nr:RdgB/HAM1 family non-canonical purine NTP pyrophosphatase [Phycisphaerae bacterium]HOK94727.1 RdgB/HAM1 family non-canonical purine NTP pyrophosphatase [Anaerohalosphaeraceae bacterium]HPO69723.1 RdgB/HAM1 family non-canonical purine NTP pyrophosphatase [Anaerohalosphaeraceae bacterium]